jgi:hypothetical protein
VVSNWGVGKSADPRQDQAQSVAASVAPPEELPDPPDELPEELPDELPESSPPDDEPLSPALQAVSAPAVNVPIPDVQAILRPSPVSGVGQ